MLLGVDRFVEQLSEVCEPGDPLGDRIRLNEAASRQASRAC